MKIDKSARPYLGFLLFAVFLLVSSFDTFLKYFGPAGVAVYFLVGLLTLILVHDLIFPAYRSRISDKAADVLAAVTFLSLAVLALIAYPVANSGRFGPGSDADDALLIAAGRILNGEYPYYVPTYLGNLVSPMPGAVLLSIPFVIVGLLALQNVFWLGALFVAVRKFFKSSSVALGLVWIILFFSPTVMQNVATGADYASNSIYILIFMWLMVAEISDQDSAEWKRWLPAVLLGVGLSSRFNFVVLMPLLLSVLVQNAGWWKAIKYLTISGTIFLLVTAPFFFYDPPRFAPLIVQSLKVAELQTVLPFAGIIIPLSGILLAVVLSFQKMEEDCMTFFRNCALVQLFVLLFTSAVWSIKLGRLDLFIGQSGYGMFTLFFGVVAGWLAFYNSARISRLKSSFVEN